MSLKPRLSFIEAKSYSKGHDHRWIENSWWDTHSYILTFEILGRDEDKEEIIKLLSSDYQEIFSMVAIVGIGGLGKTTLAQLVHNDERMVQYFEPRIWVCVLIILM